MRVVRINDSKGPDILTFDECPDLTPGPTELLVRVRASTINRADLLHIRNLYRVASSLPMDVPGLDYAGEVIAVGSRVHRFRVGDRVMGLVGSGAWAEQVVVHEREALPIPEGLDFIQAAALPEVYFTAFDALVLQGGLRMGETVLVHAVASGVGTAAAQLCRALGARVVGTSRSADKLARVRQWGVGHTVLVDSTPPRFAREVMEATEGRGADVVLDLVGGGYLQETLEAAAMRGRVLLVGLVAGSRTAVDLGLILGKRLRVIGTVLRSRPLEEKIEIAQAAEHHLLPLFRHGTLKPVMDAVLPMSQILEAVARLSRNEIVGKLALHWD
jgi:putative PIG3 family NAD(P)H quinone oxidoreductase